MESSVKRLTQQMSKLDLVLTSIAAALISLQLTFLPPVLQFIGTAAIITGSLAALEKTIPGKKLGNAITIFTASTILLLNPDVITLSLVFFAGSLAALPFRQHELYFQAGLAHFLDLLTTLAKTGSEANPVINIFAEKIGLTASITVFKFLLVALPLIYIKTNFQEAEEKILLKTVFVLGLAMAARNVFVSLA